MAQTYYPSALSGNASRGIASDETGIIIQSIKHSWKPKNDVLEDKQGAVVGLARLIDCTREISITGIYNGSTGLASNSISFVADVTVANQLNLHGFTTNHPVFCEGVDIDEGNNQWKGTTLNFISYLGIAS